MSAIVPLFEDLSAWFHEHQELLTWVFVGSIVTFVGGLIAVPWAIVRLPEDFFLRHDHQPKHRHPANRVALVIARNLAGWILLFAGILMLVAPGQGVLTILVAVALMDFPGKRRVELALVRQRHIQKLIEWLRRRAGKPPLRIPDEPRHE